MRLPEELERSFWQEVTQYEEEKKMPYITIGERIGLQKGIQQGLQQGLLSGIKAILEVKFGSDGLTILPEIAQIEDVDVTEKVMELIENVRNSFDRLSNLQMLEVLTDWVENPQGNCLYE